MKAYAINIECHDGEVMSKGHHAAADFAAAALEQEEIVVDPCDVRYDWERCIPDSTGEFLYLRHPAKEGSRGAFPVTLALRYKYVGKE